MKHLPHLVDTYIRNLALKHLFEYERSLFESTYIPRDRKKKFLFGLPIDEIRLKSISSLSLLTELLKLHDPHICIPL